MRREINMITGEITEYPDAPPSPVEVQVPPSVSMRQARLALLQFGLLEKVSASIASGAQSDLIAWEYATEVRRDDQLVVNMSSALGLSDAQLDSLFTLASTL